MTRGEQVWSGRRRRIGSVAAAWLLVSSWSPSEAKQELPSGESLPAVQGRPLAAVPSAYLFDDTGETPRANRGMILLRTPAASPSSQTAASRWAQLRFVVLLQVATSTPTPADPAAWLEAEMEARAAALAWLQERPGVSGYLAEIAVGSASAASLRDPRNGSVATAVMVDPPRSHGEIFFSSGLYRVAEHAAVSAALSASTLGGGTVPSDRDPDLWQPLMGGATRPETLFLSGWFRPHLSSTVELWARSHDAEVQTSGGRQYLHLGAWTDGTDDSALELGGAQEALDEAFSWIAYRAPSSEQEKDPAAQPQVHETPVITPSVRYDHLVPASSAAAPAEVLAREATDWPPPCDRCFDQRWFLRAGSRLSQQAPGPEAPTNYRFDPAEPVFTIGGSSWDVASLLDAELLPQYPITPLEHGPLDQRRIPQRDDYLRFRSAVLDEPLHVRGNPRLELWVSTDAPDTSFVVKLVDMHPDGYQALLREVALSTRRRERAQGEPSPMTYAVAQRLDVDLGPLSVTFGAGHRVALHVTSSSWPAYEIHPNTHWDDSGATLRPAFQSLYHDREHLSVLVLPGVEEP